MSFFTAQRPTSLQAGTQLGGECSDDLGIGFRRVLRFVRIGFVVGELLRERLVPWGATVEPGGVADPMLLFELCFHGGSGLFSRGDEALSFERRGRREAGEFADAGIRIDELDERACRLARGSHLRGRHEW